MFIQVSSVLVTFGMKQENYNGSNTHITESVNGKYVVFILTSRRLRQLYCCDSCSAEVSDERKTLCG